jgi:hypothetical protein
LNCLWFTSAVLVFVFWHILLSLCFNSIRLVGNVGGVEGMIAYLFPRD